MDNKKPVYNGYDEKYLTGSELKLLLAGRYYTTGKHHSDIMNFPIPDYLSLIGVEDRTLYRIFINDYFCRIMHSSTDKLISFFGHSAVDFSAIRQPAEIKAHLPLECPKCGAKMRLKEGKFGEFLGCSKYPNCKFSCNIPFLYKD